jgi:hypothetical protein
MRVVARTSRRGVTAWCRKVETIVELVRAIARELLATWNRVNLLADRIRLWPRDAPMERRGSSRSRHSKPKYVSFLMQKNVATNLHSVENEVSFQHALERKRECPRSSLRS